MTLKDTLFTIKKQNLADGKADFRIKWNAESFIYKAHFPNNPITPGVCLIQTALELFSLLKGADFGIKTLKNVKFTAPVSPLKFPETDFLLEFSENENLWQIKALVKENETVFAKMSMILK
jgi:3-hydroxyacyl-[acyl-carrier-protein] dehydratase